MKTGILLVNLGSPDQPTAAAVRPYLRQFLSDPRVIDIPAPLRWLLLNAVILPFRPKRSAEAYAQVWTSEGSPLLVITEKLRKAVDALMGGKVKLYTAMRYAEPSCDAVAKRIAADGVTDLLIIPQYPQYAMSSYETAEVRMREALAAHAPAVKYTLVQPFYDDPGYIVGTNDPYRFKVNTLKVRFASSAVVSFSSTIDLLVNALFGDPVTLTNGQTLALGAAGGAPMLAAGAPGDAPVLTNGAAAGSPMLTNGAVARAPMPAAVPTFSLSKPSR